MDWYFGHMGYWELDLNFAIEQNRRNVLHISLKLNNSEEEFEIRVWTMQPDGTIARGLLSAAGAK